jgi:hypothetical protein
MAVAAILSLAAFCGAQQRAASRQRRHNRLDHLRQGAVFGEKDTIVNPSIAVKYPKAMCLHDPLERSS